MRCHHLLTFKSRFNVELHSQWASRMRTPNQLQMVYPLLVGFHLFDQLPSAVRQTQHQ
jgi:hypothetical protein